MTDRDYDEVCLSLEEAAIYMRLDTISTRNTLRRFHVPLTGITPKALNSILFDWSFTQHCRDTGIARPPRPHSKSPRQ